MKFTHLHLVSRRSRAIPLLRLYAFMARTGATLPFMELSAKLCLFIYKGNSASFSIADLVLLLIILPYYLICHT